jgi:polyphosphate glucokinase
VLVVDVGGTNVKVLKAGRRTPVRFPSGPHLTPHAMVAAVRDATAGWPYTAVSIGYPGVVARGRPAREPANIGRGWVGFDFEQAFGRPVRVINDAALQALGAYAGGRMLFLGFGTGLGSAMVVDGVVVPMELGHLPYYDGRTYENYVGAAALAKYGKRAWRRDVANVIALFRAAFEPDYIVLGGGHARLLTPLVTSRTPDLRLIDERAALVGGHRLWNSLPRDTHGVASRQRSPGPRSD